jgi:uncharacterized membrane protein
MKRYEQQATIQAPAHDVYAYVSDFTRHGEWAGNHLVVTADGDGSVKPGSTFSTVAKQFGIQREHSTVTEMEPDAVFGWDSTGALGTAHHRFTVVAAEGATTLTKSAELTHPSFLAKITSWKLGKDIPAGLRSDVEKIKAHFDMPGTNEGGGLPTT